MDVFIFLPSFVVGVVVAKYQQQVIDSRMSRHTMPPSHRVTVLIAGLLCVWV